MAGLILVAKYKNALQYSEYNLNNTVTEFSTDRNTETNVMAFRGSLISYS
jgi:hypothetical protein